MLELSLQTSFLIFSSTNFTVQFFELLQCFTTLCNVCSVHREMFSTSGDVQYIGGCSVHGGDTMSTSGGYHEYIGGIS